MAPQLSRVSGRQDWTAEPSPASRRSAALHVELNPVPLVCATTPGRRRWDPLAVPSPLPGQGGRRALGGRGEAATVRICPQQWPAVSGAEPTGASVQLGCGPALPGVLKEKVRDGGDKREAV